MDEPTMKPERDWMRELRECEPAVPYRGTGMVSCAPRRFPRAGASAADREYRREGPEAASCRGRPPKRADLFLVHRGPRVMAAQPASLIGLATPFLFTMVFAIGTAAFTPGVIAERREVNRRREAYIQDGTPLFPD